MTTVSVTEQLKNSPVAEHDGVLDIRELIAGVVVSCADSAAAADVVEQLLEPLRGGAPIQITVEPYRARNTPGNWRVTVFDPREE